MFERAIGEDVAGAFPGDDALGGQPFRRETATAMVATDVLVVAKAVMIRLLRTVSNTEQLQTPVRR